jgi:hypothetical protein
MASYLMSLLMPNELPKVLHEAQARGFRVLIPKFGGLQCRLGRSLKLHSTVLDLKYDSMQTHGVFCE